TRTRLRIDLSGRPALRSRREALQSRPARAAPKPHFAHTTGMCRKCVTSLFASALRLQCPRSADQENLPLVLNSPSVRQGRKRSPPAV
ncbi:hypothetical protein, partial [Limnobacter sp.]